MDFKVGERVICTRKGSWKSKLTGEVPYSSPEYLEELIIDGISTKDGSQHLIFEKYKNVNKPPYENATSVWNSKFFRRPDLSYGEKLAREIKEKFEQEEFQGINEKTTTRKAETSFKKTTELI